MSNSMTVTVRITEEMMADLDKMAEEEGVSKQEVIRRAIKVRQTAASLGETLMQRGVPTDRLRKAIDEAVSQLVDATWLERDDLRESLKEMQELRRTGLESRLDSEH